MESSSTCLSVCLSASCFMSSHIQQFDYSATIIGNMSSYAFGHLGLLLSKGGWWILNICSDLSACCVHDGSLLPPSPRPPLQIATVTLFCLCFGVCDGKQQNCVLCVWTWGGGRSLKYELWLTKRKWILYIIIIRYVHRPACWYEETLLNMSCDQWKDNGSCVHIPTHWHIWTLLSVFCVVAVFDNLLCLAWVFILVSIFVYILCMCVCVCIYIYREREREREIDRYLLFIYHFQFICVCVKQREGKREWSVNVFILFESGSKMCTK